MTLTLKEKCKVVEQQLLNMDEDIKRKVKRNLLRRYETLDLDIKIQVMRLKNLLSNSEMKLSEDQLWFFMEICCINKFKCGSNGVGTAMRILDRDEKKFNMLLRQKSLDLDFSRRTLMREIMFMSSKDIYLDLGELFYDILLWNDKRLISQSKWVKQYYNLDKESSKNE